MPAPSHSPLPAPVPLTTHPANTEETGTHLDGNAVEAEDGSSGRDLPHDAAPLSKSGPYPAGSSTSNEKTNPNESENHPPHRARTPSAPSTPNNTPSSPKKQKSPRRPKNPSRKKRPADDDAPGTRNSKRQRLATAESSDIMAMLLEDRKERAEDRERHQAQIQELFSEVRRGTDVVARADEQTHAFHMEFLAAFKQMAQGNAQ